MSKPDWKDAPEWANWLAKDEDGCWYWFEFKPSADDNFWSNDGKRYELASRDRGWRESLERRKE